MYVDTASADLSGGRIMYSHRRFNCLLSLLIALSIVLGAVFVCPGESYALKKKPASRTKFIAHRGFSSKAPENSLAAFKLAARNKKFYGVEFDVWEATSAPGETPLLLVMHDNNTQRMTGIYSDIRTLNRWSLGQYKIRKGKRVKKFRNQRIPTIEESLNTIWAYSRGAIPVIELKHRLSPAAMEYLLNCVGQHQAVIISFDFDAVSDAVQKAREMGLSGNISTMYVSRYLTAGDYASTIASMYAAGIDSISLRYNIVNKYTVSAFHNAGLKVCVWTVPNRKSVRKFKKMGVDYITENNAYF